MQSRGEPFENLALALSPDSRKPPSESNHFAGEGTGLKPSISVASRNPQQTIIVLGLAGTRGMASRVRDGGPLFLARAESYATQPCCARAVPCTAPCCTALHCPALHCTALHCTALHCTALHCTVLYCAVLYCTVLYCTALYCPVLTSPILSCTVLDCNSTKCYVMQCSVGIQHWNSHLWSL